MALLVGTAGIPSSARVNSSVAGIERIKELGLGCMEVQFVRGVHMREPMALEVRRAAIKCGVALTAHGPYYINLNAQTKANLEKSKKWVLDSCRIGNVAGVKSVAFHPGSYHQQDPLKVYNNIRDALKDVVKVLKDENIKTTPSPEVGGKAAAFGNLKELVNLASDVEGVGFCIDFAHLHARTNGKYNTKAEFDGVFEHVEKVLGKQALKDLHMHLSGIEYTEKGEKHHLFLKESDLNYIDLIQSFKDFKIGGVITCESPDPQKDALFIQELLKD